jgi:hypothetical protein
MRQILLSQVARRMLKDGADGQRQCPAAPDTKTGTPMKGRIMRNMRASQLLLMAAADRMGPVRRRVILLASAFLAALSTVVLSASTAGVARAATITPLPAAYQVVADTAHGHLFISEGTSLIEQTSPTDSTILVTDLSGNPVAMLPGPFGEDGMTLSPDGTTLYVTQDNGVAAFSTATLQQTSFYSIGFPAYSVVVQSGRLWVSYDEGGSTYTIGSIDLSTGSFDATPFPGTWVELPPLISADPAGQSGTLVTSSVGSNPPTVASFNVSNPAAVAQIASSQSIGDCPRPNGLAVLPGGAAFVCDGVTYSTADLSTQVVYGIEGVVAAAADGTLAMAGPPEGGSFPDTFPDVFVFPPGATSFSSYKAAYALEGPTAVVDALAFSADAEDLYAVIQNTDTSGDPSSFTVLDLDARAMTTLTLSGPASGTADGTVTLTGQLTTLLTGTQAALPGAKVTITRTISGAGNKPTKTLSATTAADGTFTVTDPLPAHGTYTYTASYAGDAANAPATPAVVTITGRPGQ